MASHDQPADKRRTGENAAAGALRSVKEIPHDWQRQMQIAFGFFSAAIGGVAALTFYGWWIVPVGIALFFLCLAWAYRTCMRGSR